MESRYFVLNLLSILHDSAGYVERDHSPARRARCRNIEFYASGDLFFFPSLLSFYLLFSPSLKADDLAPPPGKDGGGRGRMILRRCSSPTLEAEVLLSPSESSMFAKAG